MKADNPSGSWLRNSGPGALVAAAFIGPGTVTVCTIAGVSFGYDLLWAMLLSIFATIILQEMSARIGIITGQGLTAVIRQQLESRPVTRTLVLLLIICAIVVGNAAYEAGNISGGRLGLETLLGLGEATDSRSSPARIWRPYSADFWYPHSTMPACSPLWD